MGKLNLVEAGGQLTWLLLVRHFTGLSVFYCFSHMSLKVSYRVVNSIVPAVLKGQIRSQGW